MGKKKTSLFRVRLLLPFLLYTVIFSFFKLEFEHRALRAVRDATDANEYATQSGKIGALTRFFQQRELPVAIATIDDDGDDPDDTRSAVCLKIVEEAESPFQRVWERMKPSIVNVSLVTTEWTKNIRAMKNFTDWVDESMSYFTYSRLRHTSVSHPIDQTRLIGRVRSVLEEKIRNPTTAPPLRIVVFGGSVTNGHDCLDNIYNFPIRNDGKSHDRVGTSSDQSKVCAWSGRLQDMMDATFGQNVVDIKNLAVGGAKSDMSTALMEFGLIPGTTPDIIIWDHGINDAVTKVNPDVRYSESTRIDMEQMFEKLQKFYQAAMALPTTCDNPEPPLVIMLDSFIGQQTKLPQMSEAMRISTAVSKMFNWYPNIWGISSANTLRPYVLTKVSDQKKMIGLLGTNSVVTHPGMMYHISIAWIIMFNFLDALYDSCVTDDSRTAPDLLSERSNPSTENEYLQLSHFPELHNELRMVDVPKEWKRRIPEPMEYDPCVEKQIAKKEAAKAFTKDSSLTCFYAWVVNSVLKVVGPPQVYRKIKPYLVKNEGWSAYSTVARERPGGWIPPGGRGSFFEMEFSNVPTTVNSLTIIYMQSYSQMWINSTLQIDCTFYNPSLSKDSDFMKQIDSNTLRFLGQNDTLGMHSAESHSTVSHIISGYHDEETSILVPIKLPLPDRATEENKTMLRLHFRLLDGQTFKIAGMALC